MTKVESDWDVVAVLAPFAGKVVIDVGIFPVDTGSIPSRIPGNRQEAGGHPETAFSHASMVYFYLKRRRW